MSSIADIFLARLAEAEEGTDVREILDTFFCSREFDESVLDGELYTFADGSVIINDHRGIRRR